MNSREIFFQKVGENNEATKNFKESFNRELDEFQKKTLELLTQIQSWFEGSAITAKTDRKAINDTIEPSKVNYVVSLFLRNGEKTLSIDPEGLRFAGGITGSLTVKIINMSRAPNTQTFNLHMRDRALRAQGVPEQYEGWVIVTSNHAGRVVEEFNEENFFAKIESFA
ncbi:hypothetical protein EDF81_4264 [Enterobacter sp. BIGb0383]|uniref:hypothetical protein n=1 Tax=unclassified Enterobacter TaxID=2608935 RepID=UPI000F9C2AA9|nr:MULTISPECIES: hypothetical protein [unclassified Enterobacter]ROP50039.1 hypothetical protein EDF81_4264 [Enterobacter sp. BIGb0383]ROS06218.1 hypothetical protein EC848_3543 [Enterobacter sp. BIGb0359]